MWVNQIRGSIIYIKSRRRGENENNSFE